MTDLEYIRVIESLVVNGRGFQAIVDLTKLLDKMSENKDLFWRVAMEIL